MSFLLGKGKVVDPLSLTAISAVVLTQGIGFLYGQVGELLRRWRDRRQQAEGPAGAIPQGVPDSGEAVQVLDGQLAACPVDEQALERHVDQLARLWGLLAPYANGLVSADKNDRQLLDQVEALRSLLEQIYQQRITFRSEQRPATGTPLDVQPTGDVEQYAARVIASGERAVAVGRDNPGTISTGDSFGKLP